MVLVNKLGQTAHVTKVIGKTTEHVAKESSFTSMVMFMKETGLMIKQTDLALTFT